ncbi:MAG: GNAT family N-acetyltransferase [Caulobacteraceae bacterium]|nr:GNAT family N-acetyltransferase [Caulobacteraceae bacterium]
MDRPTVRAATLEDQAAVLNVITLAFSSDPMVRWAIPDPGKFLASMPLMTSAFGGRGFDHDSVYIPESGGGAALWLPPGVESDSERLGEIMGQYAAPERLEILGAVMEQMGRHHLQEPHWYLPLIGVDPAMQARGLGSALMKHALARCDADGLPAYLESSNPRNISLYERHGFEAVATIQIGASPPITPMVRMPR